MRRLKIYSLFLFVAGFLFSCETIMIDKIDEFNLESGGYMRTVTPYPVAAATFKVSKANMSGTKMEAILEAVTQNSGAEFASYELVVRFIGANSVVVKPDVALKTIQASSYAKDAASGYPRYTLNITGKEIQDALGLSSQDLNGGTYFEVRGTMVLTDGKRFNMSNTGANITSTSGFFGSPFYYRINLID